MFDSEARAMICDALAAQRDAERDTVAWRVWCRRHPDQHDVPPEPLIDAAGRALERRADLLREIGPSDDLTVVEGLLELIRET